MLKPYPPPQTPAPWLGFLLGQLWPALCYSVGRNLDNLVVSGSHFGGGFSHLFFIPTIVGVSLPLPGPASHPHHCGGGSSGSRQPHSVGVSPVTGHAHHRGSLSLQKSAHSGGSLSPWLSYLAPPAWGCLLYLLRERVLLRPSPTSVGVSRLRLTIPTSVGVDLDSPSFSPSWGWIQYWPNKPHHRGSPAVLLKYTCVTFLQKKFYPQLLKPAHRKDLAPYL